MASLLQLRSSTPWAFLLAACCAGTVIISYWSNKGVRHKCYIEKVKAVNDPHVFNKRPAMVALHEDILMGVRALKRHAEKNDELAKGLLQRLELEWRN